ncbi:LADA_0H02938g1_1 [Lachancea dasiensis]|uniref:LADA_0H02938g1_1 n=1 Tax=Lachancea dasiensis TaxID=1072105 RepID=A0A1G4K085_9SACH|nr:LADA_0H02938g1_1 [Lachancea dasiensis]
MRIGLGVDLGSTDVRVGAYDLSTDQPIKVVSESVCYYNHGSKRFTQSTHEIMTALFRCVDELAIDINNVESCGVAATCSMAVFSQHSTGKLRPFDVYKLKTSATQNVVFWMDGSAASDAIDVNRRANFEKDFMGGAFIPEMGVPKLRSILHNLRKSEELQNLEVFDLHTYIAYEMANRYDWNASMLSKKPNKNGIGHDGELTGWKDEFYATILALPSNVKIGPTQVNDRPHAVDVTSCIDCYSSYFAISSPTPDKSLTMVAGTSTCYLYASSKDLGCIPGVWGPFTNILDSTSKGNWFVYEAGQSTTGKLLEHLFETHPAAREYVSNRDRLLELIESSIEEIEEESLQSIHLHTKYIFVYGELQGNRTPYCDPDMAGMLIGETTDYSFQDLVFKYAAILEFLAFQTRHVKECLGAEIQDIRVSGSQAVNARLMALISIVNGNIPVKVATANSNLMGVKGAYLMGKAAHLKKNVIDIIATNSTQDSLLTRVSAPSHLHDNHKIKSLLEAKYHIYLDMATTQRKYRSWVNESLTLSKTSS